MTRHESGEAEFTLKRVDVTNEYSTTDVMAAWIEDGMPDYWGIDEERHVEMILREFACKEEFARQKAVEDRQKEIDSLKKNAINIENAIHDIELIASRLRTATGKKAIVDVLRVNQ